MKPPKKKSERIAKAGNAFKGDVPEVVIIDNNPLSIASYIEEHGDGILKAKTAVADMVKHPTVNRNHRGSNPLGGVQTAGQGRVISSAVCLPKRNLNNPTPKSGFHTVPTREELDAHYKKTDSKGQTTNKKLKVTKLVVDSKTAGKGRRLRPLQSPPRKDAGGQSRATSTCASPEGGPQSEFDDSNCKLPCCLGKNSSQTPIDDLIADWLRSHADKVVISQPSVNGEDVNKAYR